MRGEDPWAVALEVLLARERGRVEIPQSVLEPLPASRRHQVLDLVLGVRRNLFALDAVLRRFLRRPVRHVPRRTREILRLGVYELVWRDRAAPPAVVSRMVGLSGRGRRLRGLVNAVLRAVSDAFVVAEDDGVRDRCTLWRGPGALARFRVPVLPDPREDPVKHLALLYTQTEHLVRAVRELLPLEHEELLQALNARRPLTLRPTLRAEGHAEVERGLQGDGRALRRLGAVLEMVPGVPPGSLQVIRQGLAVVQDRTAAEVAPFLGPRPGERVLDLCAAPGGKTVHLAELMGDCGEVVAADRDRSRLERVRENVRRLGLRCVRIHDLGERGERLPEGGFHRILVDAPCSNTGVLMRKVDARFRIGSGELERLAALQRELLARAAGLLRPGGVLVYATCSFLPMENQDVVRAVAARLPGLALEEEHLRYPHRSLRDGGYMARLRGGSAGAFREDGTTADPDPGAGR